MSTPTIRETIVATPNTGASLTMNTASGTASGDLLVLFHFYDYHTATDMLTPTGGGTWTLQATGDTGSNMMHVKVWTRPVTSGGANTVTVNSTPTDATHMPVCFVLNGSTLTLSVDGAAGSNGTSSTSHIAPSVSPTGSDDLLLCGAGNSPFSGGTYTWPGGMTERSDVNVASASSASTATEVLAASGATGTRTATCTANEQWCSASIAIKGVTGGTVAPAEQTTATVVSNAPTALAGANAEASAATVTANQPVAVTGGAAESTSAVFSAPFDAIGGTVSLLLIADSPVSLTMAALDPTVMTGSVASAEVASISMAALDATATVSVGAGPTSITVTGQDATALLGVAAQSAAWTLATLDGTAVATGQGLAGAALVSIEALDATVQAVSLSTWRLVPPQYTEKFQIAGSLQFSITREATVFGDDTTLHTSLDGAVESGGDDYGAIPFNTKYVWLGGHINITHDPAVRDLWLAHGFGADNVS